MPLRDIVEHQQRTNGLEILDMTAAHIWALEGVPAHHKDPFDRLLVAQAIVEGAILLSGDADIARYPVRVVW